MTITSTDVRITRYNLFELHCNVQAQLVDQHGDLFDMDAYSRFKYGKADTGRWYGVQLAREFAVAYPHAIHDDGKIIVSGPSYKYLSTASHGVVRYFCAALNAYRVKRGLEPVQQMHSIRYSIGSDAYAMGDASLRASHLAKAEYHTDAALVHDSLFIFIDDVNVTGATEERTLLRTLPCGPREVFCLHVAAIDLAYATDNAAIENVMNKTVPLSLQYVSSLVASDNFRLNTRVFRSIMEWNDLQELELFLYSLPSGLLLEMYDALVNGTAEMYGRFPRATAVFERVLMERELLSEIV